MRLRRVHFWLFFATTALAPAPLGSNRPLAWTALALVMAVLTACWPAVVVRERGGAPTNGLGPLLVPGALFFAAFAWGAAQILAPVGDGAFFAAAGNALWNDVAAALEAVPETLARASVAPSAGVDGLVRLSSYALTFWLAYQHAASGRRAEALVDGASVVGGLYALYGLAAFHSGSNTILWFEKWAYQDYLTATFVNRNSYATYAGLGLLAAAAAVCRRLEDVKGWRRLLPHLTRSTMAHVLIAVTILAALASTQSRGGIAAVLAGFAVFVYALRCGRMSVVKRTAVGVVFAAAVGASFYAFLSYAATHPVSEAADRYRVYALVVDLIAERPWTGYGLGAFPDIFAVRRTVVVSQVWTQAHCLYLELALELGVPAATAACLSVVAIFATCLRAAIRRPELQTHAALGCGVTVLVAVHSLIDFSMQIPAVVVAWAALAGTAMGRAARPIREV